MYCLLSFLHKCEFLQTLITTGSPLHNVNHEYSVAGDSFAVSDDEVLSVHS